MEDEFIIDLFWNRSEAAISETKKKYSSYLVTIANNILQDKQDAEECENDTYMHTWESIPVLHPENLKAYLSKIIRNISISRLRSKLAKKRGGDTIVTSYDELAECIPDKSINESIDTNILKEILNDFLKDIPKEKRIIFVKRYWFSYSVSEISKQMGRNEKYITNNLYILRKKLKKVLEKRGYHE